MHLLRTPGQQHQSNFGWTEPTLGANLWNEQRSLRSEAAVHSVYVLSSISILPLLEQFQCVREPLIESSLLWISYRFSYDCLQHWYNSNVIGTPVLPPTTSIDHVSIEKVTLNETRRFNIPFDWSALSLSLSLCYSSLCAFMSWSCWLSFFFR